MSALNLTDRPEWISVDLGRDRELESVTIDWELAHARDFTLRTRTSNEGFTTNASLWKIKGSIAGLNEVNLYTINDSDAKDDVVFNFKTGQARVHERLVADQSRLEPGPCVARYVMIHMTAKGRYNPGVFSLYEIEIAAKP